MFFTCRGCASAPTHLFLKGGLRLKIFEWLASARGVGGWGKDEPTNQSSDNNWDCHLCQKHVALKRSEEGADYHDLSLPFMFSDPSHPTQPQP